MKKSKLLTSIVALCFSLGVLAFGVYAALTTIDFSIGGTINYEVQAYVEIKTTVYKCPNKYNFSDLVLKTDGIAAGDLKDLTLFDQSDVYTYSNSTGDTYTPSKELTFELGAMSYFYVVIIKQLYSIYKSWLWQFG